MPKQSWLDEVFGLIHLEIQSWPKWMMEPNADATSQQLVVVPQKSGTKKKEGIGSNQPPLMASVKEDQTS